MEEDIHKIVDNEDNEKDDEVISYAQNDIVMFKIESIILKSLITNKIKKTFEKTDQNLKTAVKFQLIESNYFVSICGENRDKVIETKMKLNHLISLSRRKRPFTHLITVPFNCEHLRQELSRFKDNILTNFKTHLNFI